MSADDKHMRLLCFHCSICLLYHETSALPHAHGHTCEDPGDASHTLTNHNKCCRLSAHKLLCDKFKVKRLALQHTVDICNTLFIDVVFSLIF